VTFHSFDKATGPPAALITLRTALMGAFMCSSFGR
jgi:hypothetical protein